MLQTNLAEWATKAISQECLESDPLPIPRVVKETDDIIIVLAPSHRERYDIDGRMKWHQLTGYKSPNGIRWECDCDGYRYKKQVDRTGNPRCVDINIIDWYMRVKRRPRKERGVAPESMSAYKALCRSDLGRLQREVYDAWCELGDCTDRELLEHMRQTRGQGWEANTVWPRRNELIDLGFGHKSGQKLQSHKSQTPDGTWTEVSQPVSVWRPIRGL